jgi:acyl carrier protein
MEIKEFIKKLEVEFEEINPGTLKESTDFRELDEWSSMHALIIIALIDVEYEVVVNGEDLSKIRTVKELFDLVKERAE